VVSLPPTYDAKQLCEQTSSSAAASAEYMNKIRKRLNEDASARAEREKRRRKVLVEQLTAHQALEVYTDFRLVLSMSMSKVNLYSAFS